MMRKHLLFQDKFLSKLGAFFGTWASIELIIDIAIGKFLKIPHEETHLLTAGLAFGRKATLLRGLVKRSNHPNKEKILSGLKVIQNNSKRNVFAHSYILSAKNTVGFLDRSNNGTFTATFHEYTYDQFADHLTEVTRAFSVMGDGLEITHSDMEAFGEAAFNMSSKSAKSPTPPKAKAE